MCLNLYATSSPATAHRGQADQVLARELRELDRHCGARILLAQRDDRAAMEQLTLDRPALERVTLHAVEPVEPGREERVQRRRELDPVELALQHEPVLFRD